MCNQPTGRNPDMFVQKLRPWRSRRGFVINARQLNLGTVSLRWLVIHRRLHELTHMAQWNLSGREMQQLRRQLMGAAADGL
jgi:hypothetical protein